MNGHQRSGLSTVANLPVEYSAKNEQPLDEAQATTKACATSRNPLARLCISEDARARAEKYSPEQPRGITLDGEKHFRAVPPRPDRPRLKAKGLELRARKPKVVGSFKSLLWRRGCKPPSSPLRVGKGNRAAVGAASRDHCSRHRHSRARARSIRC
ncbi:hypothetical protein MRX96_001504 [Rhipicephalus microplus]